MRSLVALISLLAVQLVAAHGNEANFSCAVTAPVYAKQAASGGWWYVNADRSIWAGWDVVVWRRVQRATRCCGFDRRGPNCGFKRVALTLKQHWSRATSPVAMVDDCKPAGLLFRRTDAGK
jgi:hypothetical protein